MIWPIEWLPKAESNRFNQLDYIAEVNPLPAADMDDEIEKQLSLLTDNPEMGRPGRMRGTRELVLVSTPFVLVYRLKGHRIQVMRFLHHAQAWPVNT